MTPEEIAEAERLYDAAMADIPGTASDEEIDRRVHERTVAERTFMSRMAGPLLVDVKYWKRSCDGYKAEIERLTTWNEAFIKQMTEAEADRDRARDAAVALEQQLAEIEKITGQIESAAASDVRNRDERIEAAIERDGVWSSSRDAGIARVSMAVDIQTGIVKRLRRALNGGEAL